MTILAQPARFRFALLFLLASSLAFSTAVVTSARPGYGEDLAKHWLAPQVFADGNDPYDPQATRARAVILGIVEPGASNFHFLERYHYPPLNVLIWSPLSMLSLRGAVLAWLVLNVILYLLCFPLLEKVIAIPAGTEEALLGRASLLLFAPALSTLALGQFEIAIFLLILAALRLEQLGRPWLAGGALALAVLIKLLPATWLLYFIVLCRRRMVAATLAWMAGLTSLSFLWLGIAPYRSFLESEMLFAGGSPGWESYIPVNLSLPSFLLKGFSVLSGSHAHEEAAAWAGRILMVVLIAGSLAVVHASRGRGSQAELASLGVVCAATSLASPMTFQHHLVWLALPLSLALRRAMVSGGQRTFVCFFLVPWLLVGGFDSWATPIRAITQDAPEPWRGIAWSLAPAVIAGGVLWTGIVSVRLARATSSLPRSGVLAKVSFPQVR